MGFKNPFRSKYKTVVGTSVTRLVEDEYVPNSIRMALSRALNADRNAPLDVMDEVVEELTQCIGPRCERMYEYAKNNYTYGMPSTRLHLPSEAVAQVEGVLEAIEGAPVVIEYSQFGTINLLHLGWMALLDQYDYDTNTNKLMGITVVADDPNPYLADMVVVIPDADFDKYNKESLNQYGIAPNAGPTPSKNSVQWWNNLNAHTPIERTTLSANEHVRVTYKWWGTRQESTDYGWVTVPDIKAAEIEIPLGPLAESMKNYYHVKYVVNGVTKYWLYEYGAGTYPILDAVYESGQSGTGSFFPWFYFRYGKTNQADGNLAHFASTKKCLKYLGLDYVEMATAINENPDIGDVEQAMLWMAVPAVTSNQLELRYLFDFFNALHGSSGTAWNATEGQLNGQDFDHSFVIQDARFKMILGNQGIFKRQVRGQIGDVGTYSVTTGTEPGNTYDQTSCNDSGCTTTQWTEQIPYHYYRKQVTPAMYEEIKVASLSMAFNVIDGYYATAGEADAPMAYIPIDRSITQDYSIPDREKLYSRSLHFIFNSVQIVKIRWYQQAWFKFVMIIIAVIIIIVSFGSASGPMAALIAAIAAGSAAAIMAALLALLVDLLIGFLIGLAIKLFVKVVGIRFAFIAAIIAAVAAVYFGDFSGLSGLAGTPWAPQLLQLSSGLMQAIQGELQDMMADLMNEAAIFGSLVSERTKELREANKLLEQDRYLSPFVIMGESPGDYFNRTVHSGNIGTVGIGAISQFVDNALQLPKLSETEAAFAGDAT